MVVRVAQWVDPSFLSSLSALLCRGLSAMPRALLVTGLVHSIASSAALCALPTLRPGSLLSVALPALDLGLLDGEATFLTGGGARGDGDGFSTAVEGLLVYTSCRRLAIFSFWERTLCDSLTSHIAARWDGAIDCARHVVGWASPLVAAPLPLLAGSEGDSEASSQMESTAGPRSPSLPFKLSPSPIASFPSVSLRTSSVVGGRGTRPVPADDPKGATALRVVAPAGRRLGCRVCPGCRPSARMRGVMVTVLEVAAPGGAAGCSPPRRLSGRRE
mmetsp:Transcript_14599/g.41064  ORF Transcript_14599/g.41064 Transcript_14599/m.41064 type:complete len:274 (-) Transcript_14599:317-1138(-)